MDPNAISPIPAAQARPMTRAERRRAGRGDATGKVGCRFCKSTRGEYVKSGNQFNCWTAGCKGNRHG